MSQCQGTSFCGLPKGLSNGRFKRKQTKGTRQKQLTGETQIHQAGDKPFGGGPSGGTGGEPPGTAGDRRLATGTSTGGDGHTERPQEETSIRNHPGRRRASGDRNHPGRRQVSGTSAGVDGHPEPPHEEMAASGQEPLQEEMGDS